MNRIKELKQRIVLAWSIMRDRDRDSNIVAHAECEMTAAGMNDGDSMNAAMAQHLIDMVRVFAAAGHSGFSAGYACSALKKLLAFEPLVPLTGEPDEWHEVGDGVFQNVRCSRIFKQADRFNGQAYDIDGIVFREPNGACFTNRESMVPITFPYLPTTEYRDVPFEEAEAA